MPSSNGRTRPRLPPAVMRYSSVCITLVVALLYSCLFLAGFLGPKVNEPLSAPQPQNATDRLADQCLQCAVFTIPIEAHQRQPNCYTEPVGPNGPILIGDHFSSCQYAMSFAKTNGIINHPEWYAGSGLTKNSTWANFQTYIATLGGAASQGCRLPCMGPNVSRIEGEPVRFDTEPEDAFMGLSLSHDFAHKIAALQNVTYNSWTLEFSEDIDLHVGTLYTPLANSTECHDFNRGLPPSLQPDLPLWHQDCPCSTPTPLRISSSRLALFGNRFLKTAPDQNCTVFKVGIALPGLEKNMWPEDLEAAAKDGLLVERDGAKHWNKFAINIRVVIFFLCVAMVAYLVFQLVLACRSNVRVPLGIRSVAYVIFGLMFVVDPLEFLGFDFASRWMVPFGMTFVVWAIALFPAELHGDLNELKATCHREIAASTMLPWKGALYTWFKLWEVLLLVINAACICLYNRDTASVDISSEPTALVTWRSFSLRGITLYIGLFGPGLCFLVKFLWSLSHLAHRLSKYPYSKCRAIFIVYTFIMLVIMVGVVCLLIIRFWHWVSSIRSGPWASLNSFAAMQVLPSPANSYTPEQVVQCVLAFIIVVGLFGAPSHRPKSSDDMSLSTSLPKELSRSMLDSSSLDAAATPADCRKADGLITDVNAGGGVTLTTVRLMCHCAHVTYKTKRRGELTIEHLRKGLPRCEEDMDYSDLVLHKVIRREGQHERDLVVFVASAPNAMAMVPPHSRGHVEVGRVGIVSFRGTATNKNIATDFDFQMEALRLPHLSNASSWSRALVHRGFQAALLTVYEELIAALSELKCTSYWITGHSMGGSLATLLAAELSMMYTLPIGLCSFGSPRLGNDRFAELVNGSRISAVRVVCGRDPVARQPPRHWYVPRVCSNRRYSHIDGLIRVSSAGHMVVRPSFLEECLRTLHHMTNVISTSLKCICCRVPKNHKIRGYVAALHAAYVLETEYRLTSYVSSEMNADTQNPALELRDIPEVCSDSD